MAEHCPPLPDRIPSRSPSPSETPNLPRSPKRGINPPTNDAWGVEATTAPSYRTKSFAPNPRFASSPPKGSQGSREVSVEEQIDETIRLFSDVPLKTPDRNLGLTRAFETVLPTLKMPEMNSGPLCRGGVDGPVMGGLEASPKSRKGMQQWGKLCKDQAERGPTFEGSYLRSAEETELRLDKNGMRCEQPLLAAYGPRQGGQRDQHTSALGEGEGARKEQLATDVKGYKARHAANGLSGTDPEDPHLLDENHQHESDLAGIAAPNPESAMRILIDHGSSKLTSTRHTTLETRVALENKWAAEDAEWTRLEERRRCQLQQKSLEHRQLMILRDSESKAAEDLRLAVNLRGQVDATVSDPSAVVRLPDIRAPPGSSPTTIALYEQARQAVEKCLHSDVGQLHQADGGTQLSKVRRELDESISKDEGRVQREKQKQFADRLMKARKPAEWKRVEAVRAAEAQREEEDRARGRFQTWSQEDLVLPDTVQIRVKHRDVDWRASIDEQDADPDATFESPSLSSLRTPESPKTLLKNPFGSEESSDDDIFVPPSPSPKPRRLDPTAARLRDFNIGESPSGVMTRALPKIPVTPRGPQPFFGSFLFTPSRGRPGLSPEQILDKYEASLEEPETVVKKAKKWDLFAKPIPVLLPTNFGKFGCSSPSPDVPISRSVEYKMTVPDVRMREGQTPEDVRVEREHLERYLTDNEIPFEYQKDVLEKRQAHAAVISRANLTGGRSPTRSPSRESGRVLPTRTSSTRTASTNEKPVNKQLDTVRRLFTPNTPSAVPTHIKSLLGRTPKVVVTSTTPPVTRALQPPTTARGFFSPTKTTLARVRPVCSPTKLSSARPRPSSYPNTGNMVSTHTPLQTPHQTSLHTALAATRLSPIKTPATNTKSPAKDPVKVELAQVKFRLQKVEVWAKGVKDQMDAAGLGKEWELLEGVIKSRVVGAGGSISPSFADWDVEMRLTEGLERDD